MKGVFYIDVIFKGKRPQRKSVEIFGDDSKPDRLLAVALNTLGVDTNKREGWELDGIKLKKQIHY
tara:strand:- start:1929 stop:2123 length:195 start_codon:yes stop_codon:yes gene_type:complete